jgi:hypothetical protein
MRAVLYFLLSLVVNVLAFPPAQTNAAEGNAALSYWQAFAVMPELTDKQRQILANWDKVPLDEAATELIEKTDNALGLLHRGAQLQCCFWGTALEEGPAALLPHLSKARQLGRAACLRARYRFEQGNQKGAIDDIIATMVLARHTGSEGLLISILVQDSISDTAIQAIAPHLLSLTDAQLARLFARLSSLPARTTIGQGIASERQWMLGWVQRQLVNNDNAESREKALEELLGKNHEALEKAREYLDDRDAVRKHVEEINEYYDEMQRILALPATVSADAWAKLENRIQSSENGLARLLLPGLGSAWQAEMRAIVRQALLVAAIDIAKDGDSALTRHTDPAGGGPFKMKLTDHGFRLISQLAHRDEMAQLRVGGRR